MSLFKTKGDFWNQVEELLTADLSNAEVHLAVNPSSLLTQKKLPPTTHVFEIKKQKKHLQWIGAKLLHKKKILINEREYDLSDSKVSKELLKFNSFSGALILKALKDIQEINRKNSEQTKPGLSDETRAIEWMRVSFDLLKKAIKSCPQEFNEGRDEIYFSQSLMMTFNQSSTRLRLLCFNLDIILFAQIGVPLEVTIYNHKDSTSSEPALKAQLYGQDSQALDLVGELIANSKEYFYWT